MIRKVSIPQDWKVPDIFRGRLSDLAGRQRAMFADEHLLIILHEPPTAAQVGRNARLFWRSPEGEWRSDTLGLGINSLRTHLNEFAERLQRLEEAIQKAGGADDYYRFRRSVAPLRSAAHGMHTALQQAREFVPDDRELIGCRDQALNIEQAADFTLDDAQHGLEYAIAKQAEEQAKAGHRLNLLAALFFPLATLAAVFGMNVQHPLQGQDNPWLFWLLVGGGVATGFVARSIIAEPVTETLRTRERRWLDKYTSQK